MNRAIALLGGGGSMDYRGVLLIGAVLGAGALASTPACSGPDPGAITFSERPSEASGTSSSGTTSSGGSSSSSGADSGGTSDTIFGTTPFAYQDPGVEANTANTAHGGTVEGRNCTDGSACHGDGSPKPWVFGGTVYSAATNGTTVPKAEIKVVGPDGADIGTTYTDKNGNFWFEKPGTTIPAGSKVGVRKEGGTPRAMATLLQPADSGCSANRANCHGTAGTGKVFAP
jgi:hypothetical protein